MACVASPRSFADVQELIKICDLPRDFRIQLDPFVQDKFDELWQAALGKARRFMLIWRDESPEASTRLAASSSFHAVLPMHTS